MQSWPSMTLKETPRRAYFSLLRYRNETSLKMLDEHWHICGREIKYPNSNDIPSLIDCAFSGNGVIPSTTLSDYAIEALHSDIVIAIACDGKPS